MTDVLTPAVDVRRADQRFKTDIGWLDSVVGVVRVVVRAERERVLGSR